VPIFSATVENSSGWHRTVVSTGQNAQQIAIAPKASGMGSSVNGAEALLLALATCYCNDIYREAAQRDIPVSQVRVDVRGEFDGVPGHPITGITYRAEITSSAPTEQVRQLAQITDSLAEIQNTLRQGTTVTLDEVVTRLDTAKK
jgi:uncharacterized OsmC-like protein